MLIVWFLSIKSLPNLLFGMLCLPGDQSHPVCATDNKPSCVLHLLGWFIGSRGFSSLERRSEFGVLHCMVFQKKKKITDFTSGPWLPTGSLVPLGTLASVCKRFWLLKLRGTAGFQWRGAREAADKCYTIHRPGHKQRTGQFKMPTVLLLVILL